jgi:hypothetical protein
MRAIITGKETILVESTPIPQAQVDLVKLERQVRIRRNKMLSDSDWFMIREKELGTYLPTDFKAFRQALRDIPEQEGFPQNIVWPTCKPGWLPK